MKFQVNRSLIAILFVFVLFIVAFAMIFNPMKAQELKYKESVFEKFKVSDSVTELIRNETKDFVRVKINRIEDRAKAAELGTVIEDYGSFVIVAKVKTNKLSNSELDFQNLETSINLPVGKFEPLNAPSGQKFESNDLTLESSGKNYYIVQFAATTKDEWLQSLEEVGVQVLQYIPHQAYFVYADFAAISKVANHSRVRWVGRFIPENKISPEVENFAANAKGATRMYDIAVFSRADLLEARNEVSNTINGKILTVMKLPNNFFNVIRVEMLPDDIQKVAEIPDVIRIDQYEKPQREDERAAQIVAGNYSNTTTLNAPPYNPLTQFGVNGQNVTVSVVDDGVSIPGNGGFYITSGNTINAPTRGGATIATGGHGHINASIIAGDAPFGTLDPTGYNYGMGIAPKAHILNIPFLTTGYSGNEADTINDTVVTAGPNGVPGTITNNSWGNGTNNNSYDSYAALYDGLVQDATSGAMIDPICIVFSAGNSGTTGLTRPKVAKNVIAVGNSENIRTEIGGSNANNIDDMRGSSSRGPALDGRIKPDITAPGSYIAGSRSGTGSGVSGQIDANHSYSIGTSHAAPQVAGAAALFTQYWKNTHSGIYPSPALIKAAIINTAQEMNGLGSTNAIPNGDEGWGRINMRFMLNTGVPMKYIDQTTAFSNSGESTQISGVIADSTKPVRISLVWTDAPGVANPALVNNLDLTVTVGNNVYKGNVFSNGVSTTGGNSDTLNNVENIFLPAGIPAGTTFSIQVSATAINGNGILGNADSTDQHFSLVAYNFSDQITNVKSPFDFDGDSKTDISIFRPTLGQWWIQKSQTAVTNVFTFGASTDKLVPADYTGDGKTDVAFFRPTSGEWFILRSENASFYSFPFGSGTDIPAPGDFDNDGKIDPAVFRQSNGTWYILLSSGGTRIEQFGVNGDLPVVGDYDGDGMADKAIFRPSNGQWWISRSQAGLIVASFGTNTDKTVQGDYTGDGKTDVAFFRPTSGEWFILRSENSSFYSFPFGISTDTPVPGDYDGDGKQDAGVFRGSNVTWYINGSQSGQIIQSYGTSGDIPTPNSFVR
jgi:hypothetical protein